MVVFILLPVILNHYGGSSRGIPKRKFICLVIAYPMNHKQPSAEDAVGVFYIPIDRAAINFWLTLIFAPQNLKLIICEELFPRLLKLQLMRIQSLDLNSRSNIT